MLQLTGTSLKQLNAGNVKMAIDAATVVNTVNAVDATIIQIAAKTSEIENDKNTVCENADM